MHTFQINVLIQFFMSSTRFEYHVFMIGKTICTAVLYCMFFMHLYRVSQEECARLRESVPYVKVYRYNPKHLYPRLNGYGDNGQRSLKL